ncbi:MAG TPA: hypothetical protein VNX88_05030 [Terriglobales bacterium]|jgi:hypothetical protein|nr:hypothetical protein [Terriglobales bacterium]
MIYFIVPIVLASYLGAPVLFTLGWSKWASNRKPKDIPSWFSLIGFGLANASIALALYTIVYMIVVGGSRYDDPRWVWFMDSGLIVSLAALLVSIPGMWRKNALRWYAPALAVCMFLIWFAGAMGR